MSNLPNRLKPWFEARKRYKLSHAQIQMARELGMNPRNFGGLANHRQEQWKVPLPQFIERCYENRFGRSTPEIVRSLEELILADEQKRKDKLKKKMARAAEAKTEAAPDAASPDVF